MIRDKRIALVFRAASFLFALIGLLSMMGVFRGVIYSGILVYYTMQSNILGIVLFAMLTVRTAAGLRNDKSSNPELPGGKNGDAGLSDSRNIGAGYFSRFEMVCAIDIMLTFVVFWVLLAPMMFTMVAEYNLWSFDNLAVHGVTPLLCLIDYILFTQPRHLKYRDVYYVIIYPLVYLAGTSLAGLFGYVYSVSPVDGKPVRFPYFFYDFDRLGIAAIAYIGALVIFFLIIAHGFYLVDTKLRKPSD